MIELASARLCLVLLLLEMVCAIGMVEVGLCWFCAVGLFQFILCCSCLGRGDCIAGACGCGRVWQLFRGSITTLPFMQRHADCFLAAIRVLSCLVWF